MNTRMDFGKLLPFYTKKASERISVGLFLSVSMYVLIMKTWKLTQAKLIINIFKLQLYYQKTVQKRLFVAQLCQENKNRKKKK